MNASQCIWLTGPEAAVTVLSRILTGAGYDIRIREADAIASGSPTDLPDLLILAEEPPRLARLMPLLRSQAPWRDLPIIAALTRFSDAGAAQALGLGADEFITAPFQPQEVLARVMVVLRLHLQRRLLVSSQTEFTRVFAENPHPLFYCDRQGRRCRLNPTLERLLGYSHHKGEEPPEDINALLFDDEERERFRQVIQHTSTLDRVKVRLRGRRGQPVTVLLSDLAQPEPSPDRLSFEIQPVGASSPLKRAFHSLVENFLPAARDYLSLMEMTPLLGDRYEKLKKLGQGSFGEVWLVRDTEELEGPREYVAKIPFARAPPTPSSARKPTSAAAFPPTPGWCSRWPPWRTRTRSSWSRSISPAAPSKTCSPRSCPGRWWSASSCSSSR